MAPGIFLVICRIFSVEACGIKFLDQGSNPGPQHWEHRAWATGSPGESRRTFILLATETNANTNNSQVTQQPFNLESSGGKLQH